MIAHVQCLQNNALSKLVVRHLLPNVSIKHCLTEKKNVLERVEKIVGKGRNVDHKHFVSFSPKMFESINLTGNNWTCSFFSLLDTISLKIEN